MLHLPTEQLHVLLMYAFPVYQHRVPRGAHRLKLSRDAAYAIFEWQSFLGQRDHIGQGHHKGALVQQGLDEGLRLQVDG